jgi:hypothetical protein
MSKCQKKTFYTEMQAEEALRQARLIYHFNTAINYYLCEECGLWHLTSKGKALPKALD